MTKAIDERATQFFTTGMNPAFRNSQERRIYAAGRCRQKKIHRAPHPMLRAYYILILPPSALPLLARNQLGEGFLEGEPVSGIKPVSAFASLHLCAFAFKNLFA